MLHWRTSAEKLQETFHDLVRAVSKIKVLCLSSASGMFLACFYLLGIFQPHIFIKKGSYKTSVALNPDFVFKK